MKFGHGENTKLMSSVEGCSFEDKVYKSVDFLMANVWHLVQGKLVMK